MKKFSIILLVISLMVIQSAGASEQSRTFEAIEFFSGFGQADLKQKDDYQLIPLLVAFDLDFKPLTKKIGFNPSSLVQFQIEPFISLVTSPDSNIEVGTSFLFKLGLLPENFRFQPYIKGGVGMLYMSQHTLEQSTQFNFLPQFAAGFHYFFNKERAISLEYRFRHLSNSSIKQPNSGIDAYYCLFGITHLF